MYVPITNFEFWDLAIKIGASAQCKNDYLYIAMNVVNKEVYNMRVTTSAYLYTIRKSLTHINHGQKIPERHF